MNRRSVAKVLIFRGRINKQVGLTPAPLALHRPSHGCFVIVGVHFVKILDRVQGEIPPYLEALDYIQQQTDLLVIH